MTTRREFFQGALGGAGMLALPVLASFCGHPAPPPDPTLLFHWPDYWDGYPFGGIPVGWSSGLCQPVGYDLTVVGRAGWVARYKDLEPVPVVKITQVPNASWMGRVDVFLRLPYNNPYLRYFCYRHRLTNVDSFNGSYFFVHRLSSTSPAG